MAINNIIIINTEDIKLVIHTFENTAKT
jgi:hypothetical protein